MWGNLWASVRFPLVGCGIGLAIIIVIDRCILPLHHAPATSDGILSLECVVLVVLLSGLVWDKCEAIRRSLHMKRPKIHELFTWKEICKVFACMAASMVIFVAVVKVLDLKASNESEVHEGSHSAKGN